MEYDLRYDVPNRLITVTTRGRASLEGFQRYTGEMVQHALWSGPGLRVLADHVALDSTTMERRDVEAYRTFCERLFVAHPFHESGFFAASVVSNPLQYGLLRQWETPLQLQQRIGHRIFWDRAEALRWLLATPREGPGSGSP